MSTRRSGIMLCYPYEEKRLYSWFAQAGFVLTQPKLDDRRARAVYNQEVSSYQLFSSECNLISSVPHIVEELNDFAYMLGFSELDGGLYKHGMQFEDISSIVSTEKRLHENSTEIEFHVFDIINSLPQSKRTIQLNKLALLQTQTVKVVPTAVIEELDGVFPQYEKYLADNYEGIIIRHPFAGYARTRVTTMMKFKPKKYDYYYIRGFEEEVSVEGKRKNSLGAFVCQGSDGAVFNVGSGFTQFQRKAFWSAREQLLGKIVKISYQHINQYGTPKFAVFSDHELTTQISIDLNKTDLSD